MKTNLNFSKIIFFIILFISNTSYGQFCGTDIVHEMEMKNNVRYRENFIATQKLIDNDVKHKLVRNGVHYLPIVVHVFHSGKPIGDNSNPHDSVILNYINILNKSFAAKYSNYPDTTNGGQDIKIQFELAKRDTNCANMSSGIFRIDASANTKYLQYGVNLASKGGPGIDPSVLASVSFKNNLQFINLYLINKVSDGTSSGFAFLPQNTYSVGDGIYIEVDDVYRNSPTVIAHELGHFLGLFHTFEGATSTLCAPNTDCNTQGDKICDTDPILNQKICDASSTNSCTGRLMGTSVNNYMSYCGNTSRNRFTLGQKERMISSLIVGRSVLSSSLMGLSIPTNKPIISINGNTIICNNYNDNEVQWYRLDSGALNGKTNKVLTPNSSGKYFCIAKIGGCTSSFYSDTLSFTKTSSVLNIAEKIVVSKVSSSRNIYRVSNLQNYSYDIYDIRGIVILKNQNTEKIDLSDFPCGTYILSVNFNNNSTSFSKLLVVE